MIGEMDPGQCLGEAMGEANLYILDDAGAVLSTVRLHRK
jgi:hypothetical protein